MHTDNGYTLQASTIISILTEAARLRHKNEFMKRQKAANAFKKLRSQIQSFTNRGA